MKKIILSIFIIVAFIMTSHTFFFLQAQKIREEHIRGLIIDQSCNAYTEAFPKYSDDEKKAPVAVLMLHGFGGSPSGFDSLAKELEQQNIPYYAPLMTGFGLTNFHILDVVDFQGWTRDAVFGYNMLKSRAKKVIVVAHSNGGCTSIILSSLKKIDTLILLDPFLYPYTKHNFFKKMLLPLVKHRISMNILKLFYPYYNFVTHVNAKTPSAEDFDKKEFDKHFEYATIPIQAFHTLLSEQKLTQEILNTFANPSWQNQLKPSHIYLLYGKNDIIADMEEGVKKLQTIPIPLSIYAYDHSNHDLLLDKDRDRVLAQIMNIIKKNSHPNE